MTPISILIAEDDPFLKKAYELWLNKDGYTAQIVDNGEDMLRSLETKQPDLIILDIMMPRLDGFSTLKKIKENEKTRSIPLIVASNLSQQEDIQRAKDLGADLWVVKSDIQLDSLMQQINALLKRTP